MKTPTKTFCVLSILLILVCVKDQSGEVIGRSERQAGIKFTFVPEWGSLAHLTGRVWGINPSQYYVAVYIFVESAGGWWTKPYANDPLTPIEQDSTWTTNITTGGIDRYATKIIAFLVPDGYTPPLCTPCSELPASLFQNPYAIECRIPGSRVISFSGYNWIIKKSDSTIGKIGPGPNFFSDAQEDVWVDAEGLHLKITQDATNWFATEVVADTTLGYGTYLFEIKGRIDSLDKNIVLGLFTWDDCAPFDSANTNEYFREIDVEFSRWGNAQSDTNAQYVIQPYHIPGNRYRFSIQSSNADSISTHRFIWKEDNIYFQSVYGDSIKEWIYAGAHIPLPGDETPRINFWLINGLPPSDGQEAEVVITNFEYLPLSPVSLEGQANPLIRRYVLSQNYPDPFNPVTHIRFNLPKASVVKIKVYNAIGQEVAVLLDERKSAGTHLVDFDGSNLSSGVYFYKIQAGEFKDVKKMTLMK